MQLISIDVEPDFWGNVKVTVHSRPSRGAVPQKDVYDLLDPEEAEQVVIATLVAAGYTGHPGERVATLDRELPGDVEVV